MKSLRKILLRAMVTLAILLVIAAGFAYFVLRQSLPAIDGSLLVAGLDSTVTIERDALGIPTITAATRKDLAFATGYVHGQDRYFQMDLMRRQAAGELAALAGSAALPLDRRHRLHRFRNRAQSILARTTPSEHDLLDAYAAGVNAGFANLGALPFEYHLLRVDAEPWLPEDSILAALSMFMELNDERATRDIQHGRVHQVLPGEVYSWLYPDGTDWDAPLQGIARAPADIPGPELLDLRDSLTGYRAHVMEQDTDLMPGSNNWAVSGDITESGRAIVANDMHLGIRVPNTFYRARMIVTGDDARNLAGVTLPGAPLLIAGSNGQVAWGFTNSNGDWSDAVILRAGPNPDTYMTPDGPVEYSIYKEQIEVKGAEPVEMTIRETIWGPVLDDKPYAENELAVSWVAQEPAGVNLGILRLETAGSVDEALGIANTIGMPPQNFVCGDTEGNIGWTIAGKVPLRGDYDSTIPADWSEIAGWQGWLPATEYPRVVNPPEGRIWTANSRVVDADDLGRLGDGGYALGARATQIRDDLLAVEQFSPIDMLPIQIDDRALFLERWRDLLLDVLTVAAINGDPARQEYRDLVENWVPRATASSTGYRLVRAFRTEVMQSVFDMLMTPVKTVYGNDVQLRTSRQFEGPLWSLVTRRPDHLLSADHESWEQLLVDAIDANIRYFDETFSGPLEDRSWGERNTAAIRHPLSAAIPRLSPWLDMVSEPLDGDGNMPRAMGPAFGASERFAVSPGDEINGYLHMPTGQSGHPLSDFYRGGHDDWVNGRPSGFLPGSAVHTLKLTPL